MPEHDLLRALDAWIKDIAVFCGVIKPHLFAIAEFLLFVVGLLTVVGLVRRGHRTGMPPQAG
jgi:hypothetical protein